MTTKTIYTSETPINDLKWTDSIFHSRLVASTWGGQLVLIDKIIDKVRIKQNPLVEIYPHSSSLLCTDFVEDNIVGGSVDGGLYSWDIETKQKSIIGLHDAPIKEVYFSRLNNLVITGGWDGMLRAWDRRSKKPAINILLTERVYAMDVKGDYLVVGTADRKVNSYELTHSGGINRLESIISPLKYQTRTIGIFSNEDGYCIGSIEGRCAVRYRSDVRARENFAFKCHRQSSTGGGKYNNECFQLNDIDFNCKGTFATCGSDGTYGFWDKDSRMRLKLSTRAETSYVRSRFSPDAAWIALVESYDFSRGPQNTFNASTHIIQLISVNEIDVTKRKK